jgi:hypothetical protein
MTDQIFTKRRQLEALLEHRLTSFAILAGSVLLFFLFSLVSFNQNDFMYGVAPSVWAQHGRLYSDVPFVQAPLSIIPNLLFTKFVGEADIYLFARIASILMVLGAVVLPLFGMAKDKDVAICSLYIALCLTNPYVNSNSREIGNYAFPLLCLSGSVAIISARGLGPLWRGFFACAAIGLAVSAKSYFIVMCPGIFVMLLISECSRLPRAIAGSIVGFLLGCTPILYFMVLDHQNFLKWNVFYYRLFLNVWIMDGTVSLVEFAKTITVFLMLMAIPAGFAIAVAIEGRRFFGDAREGAAKLILVLLAALMALSPIRVLMQYLAPLALLLLQFSVPRRFSSEALRSRYIVYSAILLLVQSTVTLRMIHDYFIANDGLAVAQVLKLQRHAREIVNDEYKCERKFYSAEPLFLLDNKVRYPRELAAGPFLLFLGRRDLTEIGNEFDVTASIKRWNPDVVIWGYFVGSKTSEQDEVDRVIRDYAIAHEFKINLLGRIDGREISLAYRADCKVSAYLRSSPNS